MSVDPRQFFQGRPDEDTGPAAVEEKIVKAILRKFGLMQKLELIKGQAKQETGHAKISLDWFQLAHPGFPLWLGAKTVPWVRDLWGDLRDRFTKTKLYQAYETVCDLQPPGDGRPVGLVFTWPAFGECILHSHFRGGDLGFEKVPGLRIVVSMKSIETPLTIEPFAQFLEYLDWSGAGV